MQPIFNPLHLLDYLEEGQRHRQALAVFLKVSRFQTAHHLTTHSLQFPKVSGARDGTVALTWLADLPIGTFISHLFFIAVYERTLFKRYEQKKRGGGSKKQNPPLAGKAITLLLGGSGQNPRDPFFGSLVCLYSGKILAGTESQGLAPSPSPFPLRRSLLESGSFKGFPAPASAAQMLSVKLKEGFKRILFSFKCPCFLKH